jgi:hypothetical protein
VLQEFQAHKLQRKKEYEEWLAAQPFDDEEEGEAQLA